MNEKIITFSILGVGARGAEAYGRYIFDSKDRFQIVSICDMNAYRLEKYGKAFEIPESERFLSEDEFFTKRRSDVLLIATMDRDHVRQAMRALDLGYDLVLEKPISDNVEELRMLAAKANEKGCMVMVCHVLRYNVMISKLKSLLDGGAIGRLITMDQTENVCYWHQAHSFVRGNWRNRELTTPMIMQKCCHDLDLIQYFIGSRCKSVASMGALSYFKAENAPKGATARCLDCPHVDTCVYSAKQIYLDGWKAGGCVDTFPYTMITDVLPLSQEVLVDALRNSPYGRCAFACDNNVVDHQTTIMQFENGVTATLKMEAFTARGGRDFRFFGTEGELELCEIEDRIVLRRFAQAPQEWKISELVDELGGQGKGGHGGSDYRMFDYLYRIYFTDKLNASSSVDCSVESHYIALAAEESRLEGGRLVELTEYRN